MLILLNIGLLLLLLSAIRLAIGISPPCCSQVPGSCRIACEQRSLVTIATRQEERQFYLQKLNVYCSRELEYFWNCINETLKVIEKGDGWSGRPCCDLPQSLTCRRICVQSQNRNDLLQGCRQSDETLFYTCLDRQEEGERCCNNTQMKDCHRACKEVFLSSQTPSHQVRTSVETLCSMNSPKVLECVQNFTKTTPSNNPQKNLHCCEKSQNEKCRSTCRKILRANSSSQEVVMDTLIEEGCGYPVLHDALWQCFLSNSDISRPANSPPPVDKLGTDIAKLHCCFKAVTPYCQDICFKTFSNDWGSSWKNFHRECLYKPVHAQMLRCIEEVDEPCELGCEKLSYCSNFNNRPTEMFRSCNEWSDNGARNEMKIWRTGYINTSTVSIPLLDTGKCFPTMWKAIACMLAVKPCTYHHSFTGLCRIDCINSLTKCIDYSRLLPGMTPETICDKLLPIGHDVFCTPIATYLDSSPHRLSGKEVSFPCRPNPCNSSSVCMVNRDCAANENCLSYKCVPGCRMGETSQMIVPQGSLVHIPNSALLTAGCYKVCRCSEKSSLEDCITQPCNPIAGCYIGGKLIEHKSKFQLDCNTCACFAGEVICSNQACPMIGNKEVPGLTGLPCTCPNRYAPVCGANGKTYPSACVATCAGVPDHKMEFGACSAIDPCQPNPCKRNQRCIQTRQTCLDKRRDSCPQYKCVDTNQICYWDKRNPACDSAHQQHHSLCSLLQKDRLLAYMGHCLKNCQNIGPVCGQNGETYATECNAWADRVLVDYQGPCVAIGIVKNGKAGNCRHVNCPTLRNSNCNTIIPPGACCPICGSALKLLFSQNQLPRIEAVLKNAPITVQDIVQVFRQYVKVAQCDVFGYLSIEGEIVLVATVTTPSPTLLQFETCTKEIEKLEQMMQLGSPVFLNNFRLWAITTAMPVQTHSTASMVPTLSCIYIAITSLAFLLNKLWFNLV